jgi:molybdopterin-binding protein
MRISGRNRLQGTITDVKIDGLMAQVGLKVGNDHILAIISAEAARELELDVGDHATALIKATSIMLVRE